MATAYRPQLKSTVESGQDDIPISSKKGINFRPYLRQGLLISLNPPLTQPELILFQSKVSAQWKSWQSECLEYTEKQSKDLWGKKCEINICSNSYEELWVRTEESIHFIDFPQIKMSIDADLCHKIRVCIGTCENQITNKFWTRISLSSLNDKSVAWIPIDQLAFYAGFYRGITESLCKWLFGKCKLILEDLLNNRIKAEAKPKLAPQKIEQIGWVEIAAFGLSNSELKEPFKKLCDTDLTVKNFITIPNIDDTLSKYYRYVQNIEGKLSDLIAKTEKGNEKTIWFNSPAIIEKEDGSQEQRNAFFMIGRKAEKIQAVGFGYDDSLDGELPHEVARKVSAYIYNLI